MLVFNPDFPLERRQVCIWRVVWLGCSWEFEQQAARQRNGLCLQAQMRPARMTTTQPSR